MKKKSIPSNITKCFMTLFAICLVAYIIHLVIPIIHLLSGLNSYHPEYKPSSQKNTSWVCEQPNMFFYNTVETGTLCLGSINLKNETTNIQVRFGPGRDSGISIERYNKSMDETRVEILYGNCEFKKDKFTIVVTSSNIDSIKVGDKITFNRVDELPEWAKASAEQNTLPTTATTETG